MLSLHVPFPVASSVYDKALELIGADLLGWSNPKESFGVLLVGPAYAPSLSGHKHVSDVTGELHSPGYSRKLISERSVRVSAGEVSFVASSLRWSSLGPCETRVIAAVLYKHNTSPAQSALIAYMKLAPKVLRGGAFGIRWSREAETGTLFSLRRPG